MSSNDRKSTLSLKHSISVLSHPKHAHSLKRWKPGKNVRWQGRQLVPGQIKRPVSRRNRELGHQLSGILSKTNKQKNKYIHTQTRKYACWYVCLYEERERIRVRQPAVRYTQQNTQTNMHTCVSVYVHVYAERGWISVTLVTTAAQACASDRWICARALVCSYYFANLSTVSLHLPVHTVTQNTHTHTHTHTHTSNTKNTG